MLCPSPEALLSIALSVDDAGDAARHVQACPTCGREVRRIRETAAQLVVEEPSVPMSQCLDDFEIADIASGHVREQATKHLAECSA